MKKRRRLRFSEEFFQTLENVAASYFKPFFFFIKAEEVFITMLKSRRYKGNCRKLTVRRLRTDQTMAARRQKVCSFRACLHGGRVPQLTGLPG